MMKAFTALAALALVTGCAQSPEAPARTEAASAEEANGFSAIVAQTNVFGSLSYRQRIALPQEAIAHLIVRDVDGEGTPVLAEQSFALNGRQVPIPFEIVVREEAAEAEAGPLGFSADIRMPDGELLWQTRDEMTFVANDARKDLGMIMLSPAGAGQVTLEDLAGRDWMIARLNGEPVITAAPITLRISEDGQINGQASCNAYTASGSVEDSLLTIGPIALTRKACMPEVMDQEQFYLDLLENVSQLSLDDSGLLTMTADSGETLTAR